MAIDFINLIDIHGDEVRVNVQAIVSYKSLGSYTEIFTASGVIQIQNTIEEVDCLLSSLKNEYFPLSSRQHSADQSLID